MNDGLDGFGPLDLNLAAVGKAISKVQIDEALVGNTSFIGHALEILNYIFGKPHGDGLFLASMHMGSCATSAFISHLDRKRFHAWLLYEPR